MNKRTLIFLLFAIVVVMAIVSLFYYINGERGTKIQSVAFTNLEPKEIVSQIGEAINSSFNGEFSQSSRNGVWWVSEDNWNIIDPLAPGIELEIFPSSLSDPTVKNPLARKLNKAISDIFISNGFALDTLNSSSSEDDDRFYDYILAFRKGETFCTLTTSAEAYSSVKDPSSLAIHYIVACSNQLSARYAEQVPYLKALNDHAGIALVQKSVGSFALLNVHYRRSGHMAIVKNIEGQWQIIFEGQDAPSCELMREHNVPKEIYGNCD